MSDEYAFLQKLSFGDLVQSNLKEDWLNKLIVYIIFV